MTALQYIHPFPARMAPEIALKRMDSLYHGSVVLDPMCGSGTVLRAAVEHGAHTLGVDIDPMAVMLARVWCAPPSRAQFMHDAHELVALAKKIGSPRLDALPWMNSATEEFIRFWFGESQMIALTALATALHESNLPAKEALKVALSRIIVTKDKGASLGRDISHSRPHKVASTSDFDVWQGFLNSARRMSERFASERVRASSDIRIGDSRSLDHITDGSVDCVVTSPPYLNAIDYLRGHRLSLVWLGLSVEEIRNIRGESIGVEKSLSDALDDPTEYIDCSDEPPPRILGWSTRYLRDAKLVAAEIARCLRAGGDAILVVGNSNVRGCRVDNARMYADALAGAGLVVDDLAEREIPARSRYLPTSSGSALADRMRVEVVISAHKTSR